MTIIVTGAAGFIGSNIVKALNERGITDIVAVDNLTRGEKFKNLAECEIAHYLDKHEFIRQVREHILPYDEIEAVFHDGACSDTMEHNGLYMMDNNYQYSLDLLDWCQDEQIPYLYASSAAVYGKGEVFREERELEKPLNVYGYSKFLFDQVVRRRMAEALKDKIGREAECAKLFYLIPSHWPRSVLTTHSHSVRLTVCPRSDAGYTACFSDHFLS